MLVHVNVHYQNGNTLVVGIVGTYIYDVTFTVLNASASVGDWGVTTAADPVQLNDVTQFLETAIKIQYTNMTFVVLTSNLTGGYVFRRELCI